MAGYSSSTKKKPEEKKPLNSSGLTMMFRMGGAGIFGQSEKKEKADHQRLLEALSAEKKRKK